jgi:hypothetical protein
MVIRSTLSSKKASRKEQVNEDGETDSSSTFKPLEMIRLDMQESKSCQVREMEHCHIQTEDCCIQLEEVWEEQHIPLLRAEDRNAQSEQSSQMFLLLSGNLINQQHQGILKDNLVKTDEADKAAC